MRVTQTSRSVPSSATKQVVAPSASARTASSTSSAAGRTGSNQTPQRTGVSYHGRMPSGPSGAALEGPEPLVSTAWLADHLDHPDLRIVDCRWYLRPFDERCGDDEYRAGHLPGAVHLRWDAELADPDRPASMLASPERFAAAMEAVGIGDDHYVVTYDDHHVPVAARVWWALRVYGHDAVAVLDGGITKWRREGSSDRDRGADALPGPVHRPPRGPSCTPTRRT